METRLIFQIRLVLKQVTQIPRLVTDLIVIIVMFTVISVAKRPVSTKAALRVASDSER